MTFDRFCETEKTEAAAQRTARIRDLESFR
jgi:hypothetical protein